MFFTPIGLTKKKGGKLPPAFVDVGIASAGDGTPNITAPLPAYQEGDLLIYLVAVGSNGISISSPPTGYTALTSVNQNLAGDGVSYLNSYYKAASASESPQPIGLSGGIGYKVASLFSFRNCKVTAPPSLTSYVGQAITFPTAGSMQGSTADDNIRLMAWYCNRSSTSQLDGGVNLLGTGETQRVFKIGGNGGDNAFGDRGMFAYTGVRPAIGSGSLTLSGFQSSSTAALAVDITVEAT